MTSATYRVTGNDIYLVSRYFIAMLLAVTFGEDQAPSPMPENWICFSAVIRQDTYNVPVRKAKNNSYLMGRPSNNFWN